MYKLKLSIKVTDRGDSVILCLLENFSVEKYNEKNIPLHTFRALAKSSE